MKLFKRQEEKQEPYWKKETEIYAAKKVATHMTISNSQHGLVRDFTL